MPGSLRVRPARALVLSVLSASVAFAVAGSAASAATPASGGHGDDRAAQRWLGTWAAGMLPAGGTPTSTAGFTKQTVRQTIHVSVGGPGVRLELANTFGNGPLQVADVDVALPAGAGGIRSGSSHQVTFYGSQSYTVPKGARVLSDPVGMNVRDDSDLTVSIYFDAPTGPGTFHRQSREITYASAAGNHNQDASAAQFPTEVESWFFLDEAQVLARANTGAVVALGDSITDGDQSTIGANRRWPNVLARRLLALPQPRRASVLNEGIGANRLLNDSVLGGPNALARFDRDVLAQPGARTLIVLEGINDIGFSDIPFPLPPAEPLTDVSVREITGAYRQIVARAHADGLRVLGGTLLPYKGSFYWSSQGETKRQQVNAWIRASRAFDGVIDFDRVMRNPADPLALAPQYDSGDHLHPSDAGYAAMGNAIKLNCVTPPAGREASAPRDCTRR